jgi:hypothetical protein
LKFNIKNTVEKKPKRERVKKAREKKKPEREWRRNL